MRLLFSTSTASALLLILIASILLLMLTMQTVEAHQQHKQLRRSMQMGAYHDTDVNDPFVVRAVKFTKESLAQATPYSGFSLQSIPDLKLQVARAEIQVVAGMNIRLTLQVMDGDQCIKTFDVEIYDHFGDMTLTKWGQEHTCEYSNGGAAPDLESIMLEGTTVMGSNDAGQKARDSNSEDPALDKDVEGDDAEELDDDAEESDDDAEESDDDAEESDDSAEESNDSAEESEDSAEELNEKLEDGDASETGTDDDDETEEEN